MQTGNRWLLPLATALAVIALGLDAAPLPAPAGATAQAAVNAPPADLTPLVHWLRFKKSLGTISPKPSVTMAR